MLSVSLGAAGRPQPHGVHSRGASACARVGGEAGFQVFFSDFVRQLTWLSPRECLYGSRHLGRVVISVAGPPGPRPDPPLRDLPGRASRPERALGRRDSSRRGAASSPAAARAQALPSAQGAPPSGRIPPGAGRGGSRGVFKSRWAALRLPPPGPRWQDTAERQAQRSARPRPGLLPGSPARGNGKGPGRPGAPRHAHLPALLSAPSAEGIAGLLDCHRPWVVPTGWGE